MTDEILMTDEYDDVWFSSAEVCRITGATARQLDYWAATGRLSPATVSGTHGSGHYHQWSSADLLKVHVVVRRLKFGLTLDAAFREEDPPLPPAWGQVVDKEKT